MEGSRLQPQRWAQLPEATSRRSACTELLLGRAFTCTHKPLETTLGEACIGLDSECFTGWLWGRAARFKEENACLHTVARDAVRY
ncbi:hypothetical protein NDU88_001948 [Pleurodeles waltl]|uniref:Uncharacterized protein n=1 Tax=Pleurodeles waltl TaxID=8319 RepID=A0AAV7UVM9_PLEWA|nr:hypothetical protein NDU88_001948 [Pleurodeles waltl]